MSVSGLDKVGRWIKWNRLGMSLRSRGVLGTGYHLLERASERRFDALHGVETAARVPFHALGVDHASHANEYTPVPAKGLWRALRQLPINYPEWDFVDLGAGKGRALLVASQFPFKKIIGVELSGDLCAIARQNVSRYRDPTQACFDLTLTVADAQTYQMSGAKAVLCMFDPFDDTAAMEQVLRNVETWLNSGDRELYLVYWHPRLAEVFKQFPALKLVQATSQYSLYKGSPASTF